MPSILADTSDPVTHWAMIALAILSISYVMLRPKFKGKNKDPLQRGPSTAALARQRNTERQMESLLVELSEMARQITAQLDTRSTKLELLLKEADEKIAALRQAADGPQTNPNFPRMASIEIPEPPVASTGPAPVDQRHQEVYSLADAGRPAPDIARQLNRPRGEIELILALRGRG